VNHAGLHTNPNDQGAMMGKMMAVYMPLLLGYFALTLRFPVSLFISSQAT